MMPTSTPRRIGILGAGAMGTLFAARLGHAGLDVTLVDLHQPLIDALSERGARCLTDDGLLSAPVRAVRADQLQAGIGTWLVFTKSVHTRAALQSIAHRVDASSHFLSLQNGLGHADVLRDFADTGQVAVGVTTWPARTTGLGEVSSLGQGYIRMLPGGEQPSPAFVQLVDDLNRAGLNCRIDPLVQEAIWEKLAFNCAFNGVCALTRLPVDGLAHAQGESLLHTVLDEVLAVAHAHGVAASAQRVRTAVRDALQHHLGHQPSMLQDLLAGRSTEVQAIHGAVLRAGAAAGLDLPVTRTLYQLICLCERDKP